MGGGPRRLGIPLVGPISFGGCGLLPGGWNCEWGGLGKRFPWSDDGPWPRRGYGNTNNKYLIFSKPERAYRISNLSFFLSEGICWTNFLFIIHLWIVLSALTDWLVEGDLRALFTSEQPKRQNRTSEINLQPIFAMLTLLDYSSKAVWREQGRIM